MQKFRPTNVPKVQATTFKPPLPLEQKKLCLEEPDKTVAQKQEQGDGHCRGCPMRDACLGMSQRG